MRESDHTKRRAASAALVRLAQLDCGRDHCAAGGLCRGCAEGMLVQVLTAAGTLPTLDVLRAVFEGRIKP